MLGLVTKYKKQKAALDLDYNKRKLELDINLEKVRKAKAKEVEELGIRCSEDIGKYEHTYHHKLETLGIEIAKLEALKETMANDVTTYIKLLKEKDAEITRLSDLCMKLAEKVDVNIAK